VHLGGLYSALAIMFVPATLLGVYSPFAIRLVLHTAQSSGTVSGAIYGVSTAGSIVGTLGTTFFLIPLIGTRAITLLLGAAGIFCGVCLMALERIYARRKIETLAIAILTVLALGCGGARSDGLLDESVRAKMLNHEEGLVAHVETEYNNIYISKKGPLLAMTTMVAKRWLFESIVNLKDPDDLTVPYSKLMPAGLLYPEKLRRILMIGLGAGSISTYLGRVMPDVQIDVVELDPGIIAACKKYFGLQETDKVHYIESDGRVFLNRNKDPYDLIILDAFRELGVPFHMLTREFYTLVKDRLAPGGAVAANVTANTRLYLWTLATFHAVFPTVDVYPDWKEETEAQSIAVMVPGPTPSKDALMQRATALQAQYHFHYPLTDLVGKRIEEQNFDEAHVLTDDFAPVNLYETIPLRPQQRR
jgi:predicted membrane-bound spermidine synthase